VHARTLLINSRLHDYLTRDASAAELIVALAVNLQHIPPTDLAHAGLPIAVALAAAQETLTTDTTATTAEQDYQP